MHVTLGPCYHGFRPLWFCSMLQFAKSRQTLLVSGLLHLSRSLFSHHAGGRIIRAQKWGRDKETQGCFFFYKQEAQEGGQEEAVEDKARGARRAGRGPQGRPAWDSGSCPLAPSQAQGLRWLGHPLITEIWIIMTVAGPSWADHHFLCFRDGLEPRGLSAL